MLGLLKPKGQNKMNYNIEKVLLCDLDNIYNLQLDYPHLIMSKEVLKNELKDENSLYFAAQNNSKQIVGVIGINILVDHADITMIITKRNHVKNGIASLLLNKIIEECKKLKLENIFLEVRKSNIAAINLYEKFNFTNISTRKNYYVDNNESALIYKLKL